MCCYIEDVKLPSTLKTIGYRAFCSNSFSSLVIPDGVTTIKDEAFFDCWELRNITIPESVTDIGKDILKDCPVTVSCAYDSAAGIYVRENNIPVNYIPNSEGVIKGSCGTDLIWTIDDNGCLSISGSGEMFGYSNETHNSVTAIESDVFSFCPNLTLSCSVKSHGEEYAKSNRLRYVLNNVTSNGVMITLSDLHDIKDFFIAKGDFETYRAMKDNGYIVGVTNAKPGDKTKYTYTVHEPGEHTVVIRYNDGDVRFFYPELTVDEPVFDTNGLQVTISNIPGIKVIRSAYGEWTTTKQVKAQPTYRCFSNKTSIKDADPFKIQYRDEGIVTIIVEYTNGYIKVFHYNVQQLKPTVDHKGSTVTFGDLDSLNVIRYAKGLYTTSAEIKRADGSKALKLRGAVDGKITVSGLESGVYTFCVQYDDESYNYYTIEVA